MAYTSERLKEIRRAIEDESASYDDIAYLNAHQEDVIESGDIVLAQWAGIPEDEWQGRQ